jgi:DNA invertase Pin-like site-specific DNA recombinase
MIPDMASWTYGWWVMGAMGAGLILAFGVGSVAGRIVSRRRRSRPRVVATRPPAARERHWVRGAAVALCGLLAAESVALALVGWIWLGGAYAALVIVLALASVYLRRADASMAATPAPNAPPADTAAPVANTSPDRVEPAPGRRALGYVCVDRDVMGCDLPAHSAAIHEWAASNRVHVVEIVHDVERHSGQRGPGPALRWALEQIAAGDASVLVTARLEHLSPTVVELSPMLNWFTTEGRALVAVDFGLDTATEAGRLAASALAGVAGWERARLSARTRRGLEAARARGSGNGRAAVADVPELRERIARMREQGMTLQAIADALNEEGVPTLRGGAKWRPSSVQSATGYRRPASSRPELELPGATRHD